jgi:serpin B
MNKIIMLIAALSSATPLSAQAPASSDATSFTLALHRKTANGKNIMTSPYSLRQALGMAYVGAAGATREEMARGIFAGPSFVSEESALRRWLSSGDGSTSLKIGNALFIKQGYVLLPSFLRTLKDAFSAEVFVRKFGPAAVAEINAWCAAATNGKIARILDELTEDQRAVLLNAVYFKGRWATAFPKEKKEDKWAAVLGGPLEETFSPTRGKPFVTKLMSVNEKFEYAAAPGWKAVRLPYKGDRFAMIAVLPDEGTTMAAFREKLDAAFWRTLRGSLSRRSGLVAIPKFKFEDTYDMIVPMKKLGMKRAFSAEKADFSVMSKPEVAAENLYIGMVLQKTFVAVDEEGTEAAAVTAVVMSIGAAPSEEPFRFVANRPFLFVIEEIQSGTILFIGEVHDPR